MREKPLFNENHSHAVKPLERHGVKLPYAPNPNCKKCFGRGHVGKRKEEGKKLPVLCAKCYPGYTVVHKKEEQPT